MVDLGSFPLGLSEACLLKFFKGGTVLYSVHTLKLFILSRIDILFNLSFAIHVFSEYYQFLKFLFLADFCTGLSDLFSVISDSFYMMDIAPSYVFTFFKAFDCNYIIICLFFLIFTNLICVDYQ